MDHGIFRAITFLERRRLEDIARHLGAACSTQLMYGEVFRESDAVQITINHGARNLLTLEREHGVRRLLTCDQLLKGVAQLLTAHRVELELVDLQPSSLTLVGNSATSLGELEVLDLQLGGCEGTFALGHCILVTNTGTGVEDELAQRGQYTVFGLEHQTHIWHPLLGQRIQFRQYGVHYFKLACFGVLPVIGSVGTAGFDCERRRELADVGVVFIGLVLRIHPHITTNGLQQALTCSGVEVAQIVDVTNEASWQVVDDTVRLELSHNVAQWQVRLVAGAHDVGQRLLEQVVQFTAQSKVFNVAWVLGAFRLVVRLPAFHDFGRHDIAWNLAVLLNECSKAYIQVFRVDVVHVVRVELGDHRITDRRDASK